MTPKTRTGTIPGYQCPKCGGDLVVIDKRPTTLQRERPQFVGCINYRVTGCEYMSNVTADIRAIMDKVQAEADLQPADF